ncbi:MAG: endonuclease domain-containing protein [Rhodoglobus sp.]
MTSAATTVRASVSELDGLAATFELHARGHTRDDITAAIRSRSILRVRQGWYSHPDVHPAVLAAARVGGRLTCLSALELHGAGLVANPGLHVSVVHNACRLRMPRDSHSRIAAAAESRVVVHWRDGDAPGRLVLPPLAAIRDLVSCQPPDIVSAVAGLLLHHRPELWPEWRRSIPAAPAVHRPWLRRIDGVCESGIEGLLWFRMRDLPFPLRRQVRIPTVGRSDFLIGTRLVIEVDGAEYHTSPESFEADRRRDAVLSALGYRMLRFSYAQVMFRWAEVEAAVLAAVARGDHL